MRRRIWLQWIVVLSLLLALGGARAGSAIAQVSAQDDSDGVALFGSVISVGDRSLVLEILDPLTPDEGTEVLWSDSFSSAGATTGTHVTVTIEPGAFVQVTGNDLASLVPGTPILVGGALSGNDLAARMVADLRLAKPHELTEEEKARLEESEWQRVESPQSLPAAGWPAEGVPMANPLTGLSLADFALLGATAGPITHEFHGQFGGPTDEWVKKLDITVIDVLVAKVILNNVGYRWGLDGFHYNFPFSFEGETPYELLPGEEDTVYLMVQPVSPAPYSSFYGGLGFYAWMDLNVHTPVGCGDFGLEPCDFSTTLGAGLGTMNSTSGAAPMPGEKLDVAADVCPSIFFGIPKVPLGKIFSIGVCEALSLDPGDYFFSDVSATNGTITSSASDLAFNGKDWISVSVVPQANPLILDLHDFDYSPTMKVGIHGRFKVLMFFGPYDTPPIWLVSNPVPIIPPGLEDCEWYEKLYTTCPTPGLPQPSSVQLSLPVNEPPIVTLTGLDSVNEGDVATYTFTITDPDGDAVSLVTGYPHCGARGLVQGTPAIEDGQFQCAFPDGPGTTTLAIKAQDEHGTQCEEVTLQVTLHNVEPSVDAGADQNIDEGDMVSLDPVTFGDPGFDCPACTPPSQENFTALINWGEDTQEAGTVAVTPGGVGVDTTGTVSGNHTYGDNGLFTVTVKVTDDDSGEDADTLEITVDNVSPTAEIDESGTISINGIPTFLAHAGEVLDFSGRCADPGSDDLFLSWDWDDGLPSPDVTTTYLVNPPLPDTLPSPSVQPRDETDAKSHAFADARPYSIGFLADDDDGGHGEDSSNVIIVANADESRTAGYWLHQYRQNGKMEFDESALGSYLAIVGYMSQVFDEARDASTVGHAQDVLWVKRNEGSMHEILDRQLLAAWLNFANGSIEYDEFVDTDGDGVGDTVFAAAMAIAEAVRLDSGATRAALEAQKDILEQINSMD
jgi:hypothetical protein